RAGKLASCVLLANASCRVLPKLIYLRHPHPPVRPPLGGLVKRLAHHLASVLNYLALACAELGALLVVLHVGRPNEDAEGAVGRFQRSHYEFPLFKCQPHPHPPVRPPLGENHVTLSGGRLLPPVQRPASDAI